MSRDFDLGDILSVATGILVSPRHIDGVYDILNYMTGDNLFTHQLPRAAEECCEPLLKQLPQLRDVRTPLPNELKTEEEVLNWLAVEKLVYGDSLPVSPLSNGEHEFRDPVMEADQMMGTRPVIVARIGEGE